jgi:hypothetical protein
MKTIWIWIMVLLAAVLVIGLLRYARGPEHQRGDDVGAWRASISWVDRSEDLTP